MNFNQFMPQNSLKAPDFNEVDVNIKLHKLIYIHIYIYIYIYIYIEQEENIALEVMVQ